MADGAGTVTFYPPFIIFLIFILLVFGTGGIAGGVVEMLKKNN